MVGKTALRAKVEVAVPSQDVGPAVPPQLESPGFVNSTNKAVVTEARTANSCTSHRPTWCRGYIQLRRESGKRL